MVQDNCPSGNLHKDEAGTREKGKKHNDRLKENQIEKEKEVNEGVGLQRVANALSVRGP
jgi:hypothetical protein